MGNVKLIFKSLINNDACVQGGRKKPWYFAIIIALLSIGIALIPTIVQSATKNGSSFVSSASYGIDLATLRFSEAINTAELTMEVKEGTDGKYLDVDETKWNATFSETQELKDEKTYHIFQHAILDSKETGDVDLEIYYVPDLTTDVLNNIVYNQVNMESGTAVWNQRSKSFLAFGAKRLYGYVYKNGTASASVVGDYNNLPTGYKINDLTTVTIGEKTYTKLDDVEQGNITNYRTQVKKNWNEFYDKAYINTRWSLTWSTTGIMLAIDAGITIIMGFMIWILTRGKNNPYRIYTLWETQKIAYWATISPAILALILGFVMSSIGTIAFPMLMGLRIMWLSMKNLRPEYTPTQDYSQVEKKKEKKVKTVDAK